MPQMVLNKVNYPDLNAKQKEIYNFQKVSAIFANYGYTTIKLSDDWNGADFIAMPFEGKESLRIQLKGRLTFSKKYIDQELLICFCDGDDGDWYVYPHDELLDLILPKIGESSSWKDKGLYSWPSIPKEILLMLTKYKV